MSLGRRMRFMLGSIGSKVFEKLSGMFRAVPVGTQHGAGASFA